MFDLELIELKSKLIEDINNSNMPLSVVKYILEDITREVSQGLQKTLESQKKQRDEQSNFVSVEQEELIDGEL